MSTTQLMTNSLVLIFGILIGVLAMNLYLIFAEPEEVPIVVPDNSKELEKIDSLQSVVLDRENEISRLKDSVQVIEVVRTIKVREIKQLPVDTVVTILNQKLREYENE